MNLELLKYLLFGLILAYIPMWVQIKAFFYSWGKKKPVTLVKDKKTTDLIWKKAKAKINSIKILESNMPYGMMAGIPGNPQLMLSSSLYKSFTSSEMEYVILHEAGHYKLWHSLIELGEGIVFFGFGIFFLNRTFGIIGILEAILLGLIFGILMIQLAKISELQADNFSLKRMDDPKGMITATTKFQKAWEKEVITNRVISFLFKRANPYENRIKMAREEIERRNFKV